jgi:hypothetical protein
MWCIWRERNNRSFEDSERIVAELKALFFHTLFQWIIAYDCFHISSFHDFFLSLFFFWLGVSLVYFLCTWVRPLVFNETQLTQGISMCITFKDTSSKHSQTKLSLITVAHRMEMGM